MKMIQVRLASVIFVLMGFFAVTEVGAVPNPGAIQWRAAPQPFVRSLYVGVLGRQAESNAVVIGWARLVNSSPASRKSLFWRFINSPEYKASRWAKQRREYHVYYKWRKRGTRFIREWWVSKSASAGFYHHAGPFTFGVAMSLRNYHAAYERR